MKTLFEYTNELRKNIPKYGLGPLVGVWNAIREKDKERGNLNKENIYDLLVSTNFKKLIEK